jgi:hypothetical protein
MSTAGGEPIMTQLDPMHRGVRREDWLAHPFAGLEELGAGAFDPWKRAPKARLAAREREPSSTARFDFCLELGPPPRLA